MCNFFFLSFRGCLIFGMRRGRPGAIPPPIPPPPWAKCRPAQGLGLHFRPGGRGNGRGNLIWVRIRTGPWIFFPLLWGIVGLHMVFCRNATPGLRFPYCHNTKHGCPHIPSVSKVPPIVHTSVPKTASHSTPTLPPPVPKMQPPCTKTATLKFFFWPPFFVCPLKVNYVQFLFSQFSRMSHFWYAKG